MTGGSAGSDRVLAVVVPARAGLRQRGAQPRDGLAVVLGRIAQLLDLAQQVLAVGADRFELGQQRLVGGQPLVRRLARRRARGALLGVVATLGQALLGLGGARLGTRDLALEPPGAAGLLVALGLGRLTAPARGLDLAAEVVGAGQLALEASLAGLDVARLALGLPQPAEQRGVWDLARGQEPLPRAEDLDDDVGVRPLLGL